MHRVTFRKSVCLVTAVIISNHAYCVLIRDCNFFVTVIPKHVSFVVFPKGLLFNLYCDFILHSVGSACKYFVEHLDVKVQKRGDVAIS